ncbi:MAG TPA: DEAD/DEAH box helicase [Dehalococcoidia bacterium]|nr:DEAD/DEAH box helicase [Dehalococcoidia bacterium]
MALEQALASIRGDPRIGPNFVEWREMPAVAPCHAPFPKALNPGIASVLQARGIDSLYSHQAEAVDAVLAGKNVAVVTPTATGKTLCYNLPVLNAVLDDPGARALYLFPTKALAQDQMDEVHGLITCLGAEIRTFTYDGDTPADARRAVRTAGHIVITNPDMLHTGILPHHTKWMKLFENLRYVVIDELHQYRGVFGSHVANVIRRLRRVCRFYGSDPVFICCSATIANPGELAERLIGSPVKVVDRNGAPRGPRVIAVYNPPVVNRELGIRRSALKAAHSLAARLASENVQTIVFAPSRTAVELLVRQIRDSIPAKVGAPQPVEGCRSGYLPKERRAIEAGIRDGRVRVVAATNALELGIDIGGLDAAVLLGYPGTLASTWQQAGRSGRGSRLSFSVIVANSTPLNQYVAQHPDYLFEKAPEAGFINPDNLVVRVSHLKCAAFELPFGREEDFGPGSGDLLEFLAEENILHPVNGRYHWAAEAYPAEDVSLRAAAVDNFVIVEQGPKPRVIGEVDRPSAPLLIHDEAIYMHGGRQYHVDRLDWTERTAFVRPVEVDYYTDANLAVDLRVLETAASQEGSAAVRHMGEVAITFLATIFKKIKLDTQENVGWGKIRLPQEDVHTASYWLALRECAWQGMNQSRLQAGLWGMAHLLAGVAPLFLMCDPRDLQCAVQVRSPFTGAPTVFLYERHPGGVGLSEALYAAHDRLLQAARDLALVCPCGDGCPSCVGPALGEGPDSKQAAVTLLSRLVGDGTA